MNILDVAKHASVSTATVSRVLNEPGKVKEKTRSKVMKSISNLGFQPNQAARILRTFRASKILVTVPDIANPFFASVVKGAEDEARRAGYSVMLGDTNHSETTENEYANMLLQREVDGLIFLGHKLPDRLVNLLTDFDHQPPIVNGCEYSPDLDVPSVHIDNAGAAAEVIDHLVELGHSQIGVITGPLESPISRFRLEGVHRAASRHLIRRKILVEKGDFSAADGKIKASALIAKGITAIFCFGDEAAMGALAAIREAGLNCPKDISVVGFDDIHLARFAYPALTTISQPKAEIGQEAVRLLLDLLAGKTLGSIVTLPHKLVIRESTAPVSSE